MTIGEALKQIRGELCLTQKQMCAEIVTRSFYAKVESGKSMISADKLAEILFSHDVDINYFYQLLRKTYMPKSKQIDENLNQKMNEAFNSGRIELIEQCYHDILEQSDSKSLKIRSMITVAYLKNELSLIDPKVKQKLFIEFSKEQNWMANSSSLRLFTNTMPIWSQENLSFFVERLLNRIEKSKKITELNQERYLRILENYLTICYQRRAQNGISTAKNIQRTFNCILKLSSPVHFALYKIAALYLKYLFLDRKAEAQKVKDDMKEYGYQNLVKNWPE
ncbi:helix-turn-helix domain-containing protein [Lactobacillus intestinalis]|uniref:XRE family transcriptional regulator n=1 Tax=Lactobacillus intestinalis TaxID=151781 RepID=A0A4S2BEY1_9LACO|nr:helix-turn-helix transcriptional regulator [Lactobacillus intestinalis]KAI4308703.1 hypothetical protein C821_000369 [Lactobacillus intestinalis]TGY13128.1 XRE family transcriptional regulator [Lactobacillus intestinalis]